MEVKEIRVLAAKELETQIVNLSQEMFNLKLQFSTGQLNSPARIREIQKDIARMKTILREKEILQAKESK